MRSTLYRMGNFIDIDDPIDWNQNDGEYEQNLRDSNYREKMRIGNSEFPYITLYENMRPNSSCLYEFYSLIEMDGCSGYDLFFESWINVMHFLNHYTTWSVNLLKNRNLDLDLNRKELD